MIKKNKLIKIKKFTNKKKVNHKSMIQIIFLKINILKIAQIQNIKYLKLVNKKVFFKIKN